MTSIYTVRDNLKRTIEGKEQMLAEKIDRKEHGWFNSTSEIVANRATIEFLEINVDELKRILADVEKCCETATANSWIGVDRQGGI